MACTSTCDQDYAWGYWTSDSGTSTSSGTLTYAQQAAWTTWTTTAITVEQTYAWTTWTTKCTPSTGDTYYRWTKPVEEKQEQKRARLVQEEINRIEAERVRAETEERKKAAELTAQDLLQDLITEDEMAVYQKTGRLLVKGKKHDYVLVKGAQADVIKVPKGKVIDLRQKIKGVSYCVRPENQYILPDTDKVIAMKVALEAEEDRIMGMANARGERELAVNE